jgi:hypothetical protein
MKNYAVLHNSYNKKCCVKHNFSLIALLFYGYIKVNTLLFFKSNQVPPKRKSIFPSLNTF